MIVLLSQYVFDDPDNIESEIVKKTGNIIERGMLYEKMSGRNPFYHESKKKPNVKE